MKKIIILSTTFISLNALGQVSYVPPTKLLGKKAYEVGIYGEYFKSSSRVGEKGDSIKFQNGQGFSRLQGGFFGSFGLADNFQGTLDARFRQNQSKTIDVNTSDSVIDTSSGIQSAGLTLKYAFAPVDRLRYVIEGTFRYVPYTNEVSVMNDGNLILGDDGNEYSAGLAVTYNASSNNYLSGRVGYRIPGSELSHEVYWQAEGALVWSRFALLAGVDGITSMGNDPYENDLGNRPVFNAGETFLYHGVNREMIAPYLGANIALGNTWRVELKGSQVVHGKSTDLGTNFSIALIRRSDEKQAKKVDKSFKTYDFEGSVSKISPKKGYVVIDRGLSSDVYKGMRIDFFENDYVGGNILIARGVVLQVKADSSIVKITNIYNTKVKLKEGTLARGSYR